MSLERYHRCFSLVCDYCGVRLAVERPEDAHKARRAAGWEVRIAKGDMLDICPDCVFEEKGYGKDGETA